VDALTRMLCERATYVPAALGHLAERGEAVPVLRALTPTQATAILAAVRRAFRLADLQAQPAPGALADGPGTSRADSRMAALDRDTGRAAGASGSQREEAPWERWLPESVSGAARLAPEQTLLLGVALGLWHEPARVRQAPFVERARVWWAARSASLAVSLAPATPLGHHPLPPGGPAATPTPSISPGSGRAEIERAAPSSGRAAPPPVARPSDAPPTRAPNRRADGLSGELAPSSPGVSERTSAHPRPAAPAGADEDTLARGRDLPPDRPTPAADGSDGLAGGRPEPPVSLPRGSADRDTAGVDAVVPWPAGPNDDDATGTLPLPAPAHELDAIARPGFVLDPGEGLVSGLGGVFYLVNLMCWLELPEVFEPDWRLASEVGPWGVLDLLARALLDEIGEPGSAEDAGRRRADDAIWDLLAALAGRAPGTVPGPPSAGADAFRLPAAWLSRDAPGPTDLWWASEGARVRLWSARGYLLLDAPCSGRSALEEVRRALAALGVDRSWQLTEGAYEDAPRDRLTSPLLAGLAPGHRAWLAAVLPFVRRRLGRALGLDDHAAGLDTALLVRAARLYATSTHVDVVMRLDSVTLPVRLAGLDRDPGWLADFGRVMKLHFEE
jgi:hypothetical protein